MRCFTADGTYDHRSVYDQLSAAGTENVVIVIPPRRSAVSAGPTDGPWAQREPLYSTRCRDKSAPFAAQWEKAINTSVELLEGEARRRASARDCSKKRHIRQRGGQVQLRGTWYAKLVKYNKTTVS